MTRHLPFPRLAFRRTPPREGEAQERFRRLLIPHLDAAYSYARYLARDANAAEDIVQEAFLRAWRSQDSCRGAEKAWLMAILRNCYHDWAAANRRHAPAEMPVADVADAAAFSLIEHHGAAGQLRALVAALPEPFREALVLRELEGLSYREIAEATQAPLGTVMSRLARARAMLAAALQDKETTSTGAMPR